PPCLKNREEGVHKSRGYSVFDAIDTLRDIAREGITLVTLNDNRAYNNASLRQNPMDLMLAVMSFARANEESEVKAQRLREAWHTKRLNAASGHPMTSLCPAWLRLSDDREAYEVIPDRAETVARIFAMTLAGSGQHLIADTLNREGVKPFGRGKMWHRSYVKKLLSNQSVLGVFLPHVTERPDDGGKVRVPGEPIADYFPAVIDRELYDAVQGIGRGGATVRGPGSGRSAPVHMLAGLAICPLCASSMTRVYKGKKGGRPYLICTRAKSGAGCRYRQVKVDAVEDAIIRYAGFIAGHVPSPDGQAQAELEGLQMAHEAVRDQIENILDAIERTRDEGLSKSLVSRLKANEAALNEVASALHKAEAKVSDTLTNRVVNTAEEFVSSIEVHGPLNMPRIASLLRQLFTRVEVDFIYGVLRFHWKSAEGQSLDIVFAWPETED
ncbi:recombinase family protein, partial [Ferirhizobium litorale]